MSFWGFLRHWILACAVASGLIAFSVASEFESRIARFVLSDSRWWGLFADERLLPQLQAASGDLARIRSRMLEDPEFASLLESRLREIRRRFELELGVSIDAAESLGQGERAVLTRLSRGMLRERLIETRHEGFAVRSRRIARPEVPELVRGYEATRVLGLAPTRAIRDYVSETGIRVVSRDERGEASGAVIRVLSDNPGNRIEIVGEFNGWGKALRESDRLAPVAGTPYFEARVAGLRHGMQYRLRLNGALVLDPAAEAFSTSGLLAKLGQAPESFLNSVFWDFGRAGAYRMRHPAVDLRDRHVVMGETEIRALVAKWPNSTGGVGPAREEDTYRFIAESGVIARLKEMGYNAIEFLPFNMSNDSPEWAYRYQVYGLFAPDSRFGSPDEFAAMIDAFNGNGIGVVMDTVVGHYPTSGNQGVRSLDPVGLHQWRKADGRLLYGAERSPWGTNRYDYANPYVRRHLIDSIMTMLKRYRLSGIRFDNLDGIRLTDGGTEFLRDLHRELRAHRPDVWTNAEMFFGENSVTRSLEEGGLGLSSRTNSDLFDWFKDNARGGTEGFDMESLRHRLRAPLLEWREGARTHYITSHDEAANWREGFTGKYPASLLEGGGDWWIQRKLEAFGSLAMTSGSATMDMPQLRLLQRGDFSHDPAIDWALAHAGPGRDADRYFADLSRYVGSNEAFNLRNMTAEVENHTDAHGKVISLFRTDGRKRVYVVVNLNHRGFGDYAFGVRGTGEFRVVLSSDARRYGGSGRLDDLLGGGNLRAVGEGMHDKDARIVVPHLAPMSVLVLETAL